MQDKYTLKPMYLVAAVSEEFGLEAAILSESAINSETYCQILKEVKKFGENFVLFGDNASRNDGASVGRTIALALVRPQGTDNNLPFLLELRMMFACVGNVLSNRKLFSFWLLRFLLFDDGIIRRRSGGRLNRTRAKIVILCQRLITRRRIFVI